MQAMLCGTRSFSDIDEGSSRAPSSRLSKLKKSLSLDRGKKQMRLSKLKKSLSLDRGKKQISSSSSKINPYSSEGLDKFEKLLAELAEKKKQVLLRKGCYNDDGDNSVRFGYNSDTGDWVPTIVKKAAETTKKQVRSVPKEKEVLVKEQLLLVGNKVVINKRSRWNAHSQYCCLIVLLLLLLSCFMFGRAFVVCSATIVWYLLPNWNLNRVSTDHKWLRRN